MDILRVILALIVGTAIGYAFGLFQNVARLRNEKLEREGKFKNAWALMPGSGGRVVCLLLALVLVQAVCPLMFAHGTQWWVSGGVLLGYGWILFRQLRQKRAAMK